MKCENCNKSHKGNYGSGRFCSIKCSRSFATKNNRIETNSKISFKIKERIKDGKFFNPNANKKIERECLICHSIFKVRNCDKKKYCSKLCSYKSPLMHKFGGLTVGSSRGKSGWYKGYWCDSSWELAFVIYNLEHNIKFERNKRFFEYGYLGKIHKFFPDFILNGIIIVEIKSYIDERSEAKINSVKDIIVLTKKNGIEKYLEYVINKYGKHFINLYENKMASGSAGCGRLPVTEFKQTGSNPDGAAKLTHSTTG